MIWNRVVRASNWNRIYCISLPSGFQLSRSVWMQCIEMIKPSLVVVTLLFRQLFTDSFPSSIHLSPCSPFIPFHLTYLQYVFAFFWKLWSRTEVCLTCEHSCRRLERFWYGTCCSHTGKVVAFWNPWLDPCGLEVKIRNCFNMHRFNEMFSDSRNAITYDR